MILLAPERNFVRNGSFTVKDFRLYDETSSSKGRSPAVHIAQTSRSSLRSLPKQMMATPGGECQKMLARPARRRTVTR